MIWFQTNFRCYVHPPCKQRGILLPLGFTYIFSPWNSIKRKFHPSGRGSCSGCRSYLAGPTRRGSVDRKCYMGIQRLSSHPLLGWIRTRGVFSPLILFFFGMFHLKCFFYANMCVGWIPEKNARQNRTDLEKSCNLKSFFWNTFNGWKLNIQGKG